ncbi:cytochrome c biogenesis protein CcdA [Orenia metallireducens]|uniref:Cytochrome c biogenesis protein CcdA n=1 Tax=Orenia metallireducens TaxID=1413210 RepID=A0A1C0A8Y0_9FIRM|nr:cytochrome c biogenesis protein CcdA [Orenia metallireducens]OCL26695.1 cytochrome c biogenesis protein CcdA [Orenia metallireducens]
MENISISIAFSAGFISFLSPCVLPLVPAYVSYITGSTAEQGKVFTLIRAIAFVIGFSIIFILMGASASYLGRIFAYYKPLFTKISAILIIIFGLHMSGLLKVNLLYKQFRFSEPKEVSNWVSSIVIGMAFAAGWTPCVGTVLGSILLYAGTEATLSSGILLLIFYSLGLGIPFIITAVFINKFTRLSPKINRYLPVISKISGIIMIIFGLLLLFNRFQNLSRYFYIF